MGHDPSVMEDDLGTVALWRATGNGGNYRAASQTAIHIAATGSNL
jgi:hypothetical protein